MKWGECWEVGKRQALINEILRKKKAAKVFTVFLFHKKGTGEVDLCALLAFIRGGNWDNGTNAGAFALNLNNSPTDTNTNIGFRCGR